MGAEVGEAAGMVGVVGDGRRTAMVGEVAGVVVEEGQEGRDTMGEVKGARRGERWAWSMEMEVSVSTDGIEGP